MALVERDGVKLAYDSSGAGAGGLLFIHGWCCDRTYFAPQYDHFGTTRPVATMDVRGHGDSDQPADGYDMESFADDALAVAAAAGLERPIAVGHSMGGVIALHLAAREGAVAGAVMVDPAPIIFSEETKQSFLGFGSMVATDADGALRKGFVAQMFLPTDTARREEIISGMTTRPPAVASACIPSMMNVDGKAVLARVKGPLLSIGSAAPTNSAPDLREHCSTLTIGQTVGSGHFNQLEVPDQVNAMIEQFLRVNDL